MRHYSKKPTNLNIIFAYIEMTLLCFVATDYLLIIENFFVNS